MLSIHGQKNPYMSDCKVFFKTKQDLQQHINSCEVCNNKISSNDEFSSEKVGQRVKYEKNLIKLNFF